jgi:hypothetical protein
MKHHKELKFSVATSAMFDGLIAAGLVPHFDTVEKYQGFVDWLQVAYNYAV